MTALPKRQELNIKETWDLSLLYPSQTAFEAAVNEVQARALAFKETYFGQLKDAKTLIAALDQYESIFREMSKISSYGSLGYETDKTNLEYESNINRLQHFVEVVGAALAFFETEISQADPQILNDVLVDDHGAQYQYYLQEILEKKSHLLSTEVEEVLSALTSTIDEAAYNLYGTLKFQDLSFDDFTVGETTYPNSFVSFEGDLEVHPNLEVRHAAWKSFHEGLAKYQNTAAENYLNQVKKEKKIASLRGFDSVFDYLLFEQKVSREAYNRQIDVIMTEFAPVMRRYACLLQEEQGLSHLTLADIKIPFTRAAPEKISIEASRKLLEDVFSVFGPEYLEVVSKSFEERWIDFPMNETKSTGGFCATVYQGPSYILLNWTGFLSEVLVLAHELGHAGHFNLTYANQLVVTPEASLYFIEAPSTANEVITCQYLLNQPLEAEQKRVLISEFISRTYFHNMVTHLLEADFQRKVYTAIDKGEYLNADNLNQFFKETLETFWGDALTINEGAELTWMRQPHYFMGLYSYTYSAGLTIGTQVGQKVAAGDQATIAAWLEVLKAGGTLSPLELAHKAGVSMEDATSLRQAIAYVDGLLDQIEALKTK